MVVLKKWGKTTFSLAVEKQLCDHLLLLERHFYGLKIEDVRRLAYQLAEKNNIQHKFNEERQMAGKKWCYAFMKRHPELSIRQPESTSMAKVKGFNYENVHQFFDLLEEICDKHKLDGTKIT